MITTESLPHRPIEEWLSMIEDRPYYFLFDSGWPHYPNHQISYLGWDPLFILETEQDQTLIHHDKGIERLNKNPFDILQSTLHETVPLPHQSIDFVGGWVGQVHFEAAHFIDDFSTLFPPPHKGAITMGLYNHIIAINHKDHTTSLIKTNWTTLYKPPPYFSKLPPLKQMKITDLGPPSKPKPSVRTTSPTSNLTKADYLAILQKAKKYIFEGDIYQVNLSHRFKTHWEGSPTHLFTAAKRISPVPYGSVIKHGNDTTVSLSPECFMKTNGTHIQTRPIKGTIKRGKSPQEDRLLQNQLKQSEKDIAELVMIMDLERHDLGQICDYGSVNVTNHIELEVYPQLSHLMATITGQLRSDITSITAFKTLFPGGSITGAPKIRSVEIINALETVPRHIYTGCMGYFGLNNIAQFNIAIRTMYTKDSTLYYHTGCGIVADSQEEHEWEESLLKAAAFFETLNQQSKSNQ